MANYKPFRGKVLTIAGLSKELTSVQTERFKILFINHGLSLNPLSYWDIEGNSVYVQPAIVNTFPLNGL